MDATVTRYHKRTRRAGRAVNRLTWRKIDDRTESLPSVAREGCRQVMEIGSLMLNQQRFF